MELNEIMRLQSDFDRKHAIGKEFYTQIDESNLQELEHLIVCVVGELGEFANVLKKIVRGDVAYDAGRPMLEEELIDVFIYVLKIAHQFDVNLEVGFQEKLKLNAQRFRPWAKP